MRNCKGPHAALRKYSIIFGPLFLQPSLFSTIASILFSLPGQVLMLPSTSLCLRAWEFKGNKFNPLLSSQTTSNSKVPELQKPHPLLHFYPHASKFCNSHLVRVSSKGGGGGGGGGRRGSFPPKQLNFPPKLTQLPPQDIANNYNYEVYPPFTVALQPHDP